MAMQFPFEGVLLSVLAAAVVGILRTGRVGYMGLRFEAAGSQREHTWTRMERKDVSRSAQVRLQQGARKGMRPTVEGVVSAALAGTTGL